MDLLKPALGQPKKTNKTDSSCATSVRFELSLKTSSDSECPEFSYLELVKDRSKAEKKKSDGDHEDTKEKHDLESMAKYFEQKYGAKKKRKDRMRDLADVGYGYDETDPFVDNSECYDELIPSSLTTQFGGFYINSGKLEFKQVSDDSNLDDEDSLPLASQLKKGKLLSSDEDTNDSVRWKKIKKRKASLEREEKRRKLSLQGKEKLGKLSKSSKKTKVQLLVAKARKAQHHNSSSSDKLTMGKHKTKKKTVVNGAGDKDGKATSDFVTEKASKRTDGNMSSSSDEVILSRLSSREESKPAPIKDEPKLPQSIPNTIKEKINSLTKIAKTNENEGKLKFFSPDVNHLLLGIEAGSQSLSNRERSGIYQHLTPHMPCSKDTLIRRMKKLHQSKQDEIVRAPLADLKRAIDDVMEEQSKRYDEECAAQQLAKLDNPLAASTDEDDDGASATPSGEEKTKRTYAPRRKFQWNDKIRSLLYDVIKVKLKQMEENKNKQNVPAEEYLKNFFETEVKGLWPKGWMQSRVLYKESRHIHGNVTGNLPKTKKGAPAPARKPVKSEKKISSTSISSSPGDALSRSMEASMSVSMPLNSSTEDLSPMKRAELMNRAILNAQKDIEDKSPSKRADLMNRAILSAQKEMAQPKTVRKKADTTESGKNCYVKLSSHLKDATHNPSQPMSELAAKSSSSIKTEQKKDEFLSIDELLKQNPAKPKQDITQISADDVFKQLFSAKEVSHQLSSKTPPKTITVSKDHLKEISPRDASKHFSSPKDQAEQFSTTKDSSQQISSTQDMSKQHSSSKDTSRSIGLLKDPFNLLAFSKDAVKQVSAMKDSMQKFSAKDVTKQPSASKTTSKLTTTFKDSVKPYSTSKDHSKYLSTSKDHSKHVTSSKAPSKLPANLKEPSKRLTTSKQAGLAKKSVGTSSNDKAAKNSILPTSMDNYSEELLKLALMTPPGSSMLPGLICNSESLPQSTFDDLANFMKLQQATLEKQLRATDQVQQRGSKQQRSTDTSPQLSSKPIHSSETCLQTQWASKQHRPTENSQHRSSKQLRAADASPQRSSAGALYPYSQSGSNQSFSKSNLSDAKHEKTKISGARQENSKHQQHQSDSKKQSSQGGDLVQRHRNPPLKKAQQHQNDMQNLTHVHARPHQPNETFKSPILHSTNESYGRTVSAASKRSYQSSDFNASKRPVSHADTVKRSQLQHNDPKHSAYSKEQRSSFIPSPQHSNTVSSSPQHHAMITNNHISPTAKTTSPRSTTSKESFRVAEHLTLQKEGNDHFSLFSASYPSSFVASDNMSTHIFTPPSSVYLPSEPRDSPYQPPSESNRFVHASASTGSQLDDAAMEALLSVHQQLRPGTRK